MKKNLKVAVLNLKRFEWTRLVPHKTISLTSTSLNNLRVFFPFVVKVLLHLRGAYDMHGQDV